uniref:Putative transmembrane protein n=1 Tax=Toxoplasma gondii COUG TaxID=1074873 RepID=A0A2G8YC78_TOXGO|nr:putative transmembrane protein [Toxoplasma gondii COUG]
MPVVVCDCKAWLEIQPGQRIGNASVTTTVLVDSNIFAISYAMLGRPKRWYACDKDGSPSAARNPSFCTLFTRATMATWILTSLSANQVISLLCFCLAANIVLVVFLFLQKAGVLGEATAEGLPPPRKYSHPASQYFKEDPHLPRSTFLWDREDAAAEWLASAEELARTYDDRSGDQRQTAVTCLKNHDTGTCVMFSFGGSDIDWIFPPWLSGSFPPPFPPLSPICSLVELPMASPLSCISGGSPLVSTSTDQQANRKQMWNPGKGERELRPEGCVTVGGICVGPLPCCKGAVCMSQPGWASTVPTCYSAGSTDRYENTSFAQDEPIQDVAYLSDSLWFKRRWPQTSRS